MTVEKMFHGSTIHNIVSVNYSILRHEFAVGEQGLTHAAATDGLKRRARYGPK